MPSTSPSYAKNIIRRAFRQVIDQAPSRQEEEKLWAFFASECAYCGKKLQRNFKEGHIDHLISASNGGQNHLSNRVLSCANCNENEKRDFPWEEFLGAKALELDLFEHRRTKILDWQKQNLVTLNEQHHHLVKIADDLANQVIELFELNIAELKRQTL